jgi:hypothetical protein
MYICYDCFYRYWENLPIAKDCEDCKKGNVMNETVQNAQELPEVEIREYVVDENGNEIPAVEKTTQA